MSLGEFGRIARFFRPLARGFPGSLDLYDDAAFLTPVSGYDLVISTDALVEGLHVPENPPAALFAHKALRTNLSDLAAKGAMPLCYFLSLATPKSVDDEWVAGFVQGLAEVQQAFGLHLAGGDSVSTRGPIMVSITIIGTVPQGRMIRRDGAKIGDVVYVSGWIGDGLLGLRALTDMSVLSVPDGNDYPPIERYWCPRPRLDLGNAMRGTIHAAADISDGLVADLEKICIASHVSARIDLSQVPFSPVATAEINKNPDLRNQLVTAGDDYELVCTGPAGLECIYPLHPIGEIIKSEDGVSVEVYNAAQQIYLERKGWSH